MFVSAHAAGVMLAHARRERPRECCGLLVGNRGRVAAAVPMHNVARGRTRYQIDPRAHITLNRVLRRVAPALAVVGAYHSHPRGRAVPSETDLAEAQYPDWIYVIVGLGAARPETRAFRIARGHARRITFRVS